jgi:outer membrane protein assembly factor BamC
MKNHFTLLSRLHKLLAPACCALIVSGCAFISDRSSEYKGAKDIEPLQIPETLTDKRIQERYAVPEIDGLSVAPGDFTLPPPPDATAGLSEAPFELKRVANDVWLEVAIPPSRAWPLIERFWTSYDVEIVHEVVEKGHFATGMLDGRPTHQDFIETLESSKHGPVLIDGMSFQTRLVQGVRRNTSELEVRAFLPKTAPQNFHEWSSARGLPSIERALLEEIGRAITNEDDNSRYSLSAVNIGDKSLVSLLEDEAGYGYLELNLSFKRAWTEISEALASSGVIVSGQNREQAVFFISYLDQEDIDSWYTTESGLNELKSERNAELRFYPQGPNLIHVRAKLLSEELEPEDLRTLMELVFSHIS